MLELQPDQTAEGSSFVCDCKAWLNPSCEEEGFYGEHEDGRYCILHFPGTKDMARFDAAIKRKLDRKDYNFGRVFFPQAINFANFVFDDNVDFHRAVFNAQAIFSDATFTGVGDFDMAKFCEKAKFDGVEFQDRAIFSSIFEAEADFSRVKFMGAAYFWSAQFKANAFFVATKFNGGSDFHRAVFSQTSDFEEAVFNGFIRFESAKFRDEVVFFRATFNSSLQFNEVTFDNWVIFFQAVFKDSVRFDGSRSQHEPFFGEARSLNLQFARFEKPDRVSFHTVSLQPQWFINVDPRKFEFINVTWKQSTIFYLRKKQNLSAEPEAPFWWFQHPLFLRMSAYRPIFRIIAYRPIFRWLLYLSRWTRRFLSEYAYSHNQSQALLSLACRQLAINAEENHRYAEASRFRYASMEARRLEKFSGFVPWRLDWWYWLASGYGESIRRAFLVFLSLIILFTFAYTRVDFDHSGKATTQPDLAPQAQSANDAKAPPDIRSLNLKEAVVYSLNASILQKPEPKPHSFVAKLLVWLENVLGPAQAALLALAVRRRFTR